ncbi:sensor histidine kinase [Paenibacillus prosopidis]|uniref:Sensor histidine kinase YesM n=1 Tax=Paenibacillus prosopidis TaxID=630520 RepID=A0A368W2Y6_9BACL|nr:histidine kinase [Paenibacillus prosopidis]RCW49520.1 sensor histidine kinase YesM [Paenibacillus prosopidis]
MAKRMTSKSYPIRHYVKVMLLILFSVLVLDCLISFAAISIVKQQNGRYLQNTANMYINRINLDFSNINQYMGWTLANDENVKTMNKFLPADTEFRKANTELYKRFSELQKNYEQKYNFFVYLRDQQYFLNSAPTDLIYPDYLELKKQIFSYVQDKNLFEKFYSNWSPILLNDKYFIINIVPYYESYLICLISADNLIRPLQQIDLGGSGSVSLIDHNGDVIVNPKSEEETVMRKDAEKTSLLDLAKARTTVSGQFSNATFGVNMLIKFGTFEKIMIAQLLIMLLAVIVACTLCGIMVYFNILILRPLKNFSYNLTQFNEDSKPLELKMNRIVELEYANKLFKNLLEQIRIFKIDSYEHELEKQKIQLDYMKLQIKPHFFLNCLTNIYSMAQMHMFEEIQSMAISTSNYFRYIFQNGQDFVRLDDEIDHVRIYLEIQKHRYRDAFSYRIEKAAGTGQMKIPPLVLQTFIENSVKYAVSRVNEVQIRLDVSLNTDAEKEVAVIRISDTGPGFAPEILERLQSGQPLDQSDGHRIGIMNTKDRLEYLYRNKANIFFSNSEDGGACVSIHLPHPPSEQL